MLWADIPSEYGYASDPDDTEDEFDDSDPLDDISTTETSEEHNEESEPNEESSAQPDNIPLRRVSPRLAARNGSAVGELLNHHALDQGRRDGTIRVLTTKVTTQDADKWSPNRFEQIGSISDVDLQKQWYEAHWVVPVLHHVNLIYIHIRVSRSELPIEFLRALLFFCLLYTSPSPRD